MLNFPEFKPISKLETRKGAQRGRAHRQTCGSECLAGKEARKIFGYYKYFKEENLIMRINHNIMAMNTHRQYGINNTNIAKSIEKLSSGYRINRAGDDAAGLAISEKMRAQIRGLQMASKNSQDAISLVQTAEGALQTTHDVLQRMRELAVQSASDTNETKIDRAALDKEFKQLIAEIDDTALKTRFNDMGVIDGTYQQKLMSATSDKLTVTAIADAVQNDGTTVITVNKIDSVPSSAPTTNGTTTAPTGTDEIAAATFTFDAAIGAAANGQAVAFDLRLDGDTGNAIVTATMAGKNYEARISDIYSDQKFGDSGKTVNVVFDGLGTLSLTTGSLKLVAGTATPATEYSFLDLKSAFGDISHSSALGGVDAVKGRSYLSYGSEDVMLEHGQTTASFSNGLVLKFASVAINDNGDALNLTSLFGGEDGTDITVTVTSKVGKDFIVQTGANQGDELAVNIDNMNAKTLGISHSAISDRRSSSMAITEVNNALNKVSMQRADLGALQNRLEFKIQNLDISAENLQAAEARIRDLDMAKEMTNFTRNNILAQAATAMLAQANALPQGVLQLLG